MTNVHEASQHGPFAPMNGRGDHFQNMHDFILLVDETVFIRLAAFCLQAFYGFLPDAFSVVGINIVEGFRADQLLVGIAGEFFVKRSNIRFPDPLRENSAL